MKGTGFAFDAFGQWSEHERKKMKSWMKVGIEWRPSMAGRPNNCLEKSLQRGSDNSSGDG
jgi:hypothetical protein